MPTASDRSRHTLIDALDALIEPLADDVVERLAFDVERLVGLLNSELSVRRALADQGAPAEARDALATRLLTGRVGEAAVTLTRTAVALAWTNPRDLLVALERCGASAAMALAERRGHLEEVEDELFAVSRLLETEYALRDALTNRRATNAEKSTLVRDLFGPKVHRSTLELIDFAVTGPHARTIDQTIESYISLAARRRERILATVTTAIPLTDEQATRLAGVLARIYHHRISLQQIVDPEVIGGVRCEVSGETIDATISTRIAALRTSIR